MHKGSLSPHLRFGSKKAPPQKWQRGLSGGDARFSVKTSDPVQQGAAVGIFPHRAQHIVGDRPVSSHFSRMAS